MVTSRERTRVTLLRLALCYSVVLLRSAHKLITSEDRILSIRLNGVAGNIFLGASLPDHAISLQCIAVVHGGSTVRG